MKPPDDDKPKLAIVKEGDDREAPPHNLVRLPVITRLNMEPDEILREALGRLESVVIVGYTPDPEGDVYFASSVADAGTVAWLLQRGIYKLNQKCDEMEDESDGPRDKTPA